MGEALLPCPFCGGEAKASGYGLRGCTTCNLFMLTEMWNRRAQPTEVIEIDEDGIVHNAPRELTCDCWHETRDAIKERLAKVIAEMEAFAIPGPGPQVMTKGTVGEWAAALRALRTELGGV